MSAELHGEQGPLLWLAGPGTGKTRRLALQVKCFVEQRSISPDEITLVTFTGAAAREMRTRISNPEDDALYIAGELQPRNISTMHSLGYGILQRKPQQVGLRLPIRVVTQDNIAHMVLEDASQLLGLRRQQAAPTAKCRRDGRCQPTGCDRCNICEQYKKIMRACNAIDYHDQILLACELLRADTALLEEYRKRCRYLLVDEYQDINAAQFELIRLLSGGNPEGLYVAGDDDQSIYSWRGGSPEFVRSFCRDFGKAAKVKPLTESHRCHKSILEAALAVVGKYDPQRLEKESFQYGCADGPKIQVHNVPSEEREAEIALAIIRQALPSKTVLVLVPTRAHARRLMAQLRGARIDYFALRPLPGEGLPLLDRLGAWLRDEDDSIALRECLQAVVDSGAIGVPGPKVRKPEKIEQRESALREISLLWHPVTDGNASLWQSLCSSCGDNGLLAQIHARLEALRSAEPDDWPVLVKEAVSLLRPWSNTHRFLDEISDWVRLAQMPDEPTGAVVRIMTLQGAKGLEADVVCVLGLEEGTIPRERASPDEMAEQARLMYVSMTRAKSELHLFHVRKRSGDISFQSPYTSGDKKALQPSSFLSAIPEQYCEQRFHPAKS